jgi:hypothetical protein
VVWLAEFWARSAEAGRGSERLVTVGQAKGRAGSGVFRLGMVIFLGERL